MMGMGWMMGPGWMATMTTVGVLIWLGLLALLVLALIAAVRWLTAAGRHSAGAERSDRALDLLRQRYARGELSRDDFQRMRQDLS
jgi:putative membrane protein